MRLAFSGALAALAPDERARLTDRSGADDAKTVEDVRGIIADVRARGDEALRDLARLLDGVALEALEVPPDAWAVAWSGLDSAVAAALERAAANVAAFHRAQRPADVTLETEPGVRLTRTYAPLARAGVYAPGGSAAYPSSVLMGVVPARTAGVGEVVVCSPPSSDGRPPEAVMAACHLAGADRLFAVGGAGAVAALAFGTSSVPGVDVIVGPGNRWVTEAKRQVAGHVRVDAPAGPSEVLVVADATADAGWIALELLAQAEHDRDAAVVLVTDAAGLADDVARELAGRVAAQPRAAIIEEALSRRGAVLVASDLEEALAFADDFAPEHLLVVTASAARDAARVRTAGTVFIGPWSSVAFGDYVTGANHVLPTAGRARSFSGLSLATFMRSYTVQELDAAAAAALAIPTSTLADVEGLPAHAAAALARVPS